MGEAVYSLRAEFSKKITAEQQTAITTFFNEGVRAYDFWQDNRGGKMSTETFWQEFKTQFPVVAKYLKKAKLFGKDKSNGLAGKLDFGSAEDVESSLLFEGPVLYYSAEVWHFADWDGLGAFLKTKFGAVKVDWLSDEYGPSGWRIIRVSVPV